METANEEPTFILHASDPYSPMLVRLWADLRDYTGPKSVPNKAKVNEAQMCAMLMEQWRKQKEQDGNTRP
jgi:hypothetical protein